MGNNNSTPSQELFVLFSSNVPIKPLTFLEALERSKINERESIELLDSLLRYWIDEYKKALHKEDTPRQTFTQFRIDLLKRAFEQPPMPGSSKLFWKNLALQMMG